LLDQHPRIKELRAQIADLERQMRIEADRLVRSLENDAKLASSKVDELGSALDQLKRRAASSNEQDVVLRALERDAKSQRDLLESYLAKFREASARDSIGAAAPDARIISTVAVSTTPAWPKKLPIILVAALAMFTLSSVFIMSSQLLRTMPMQAPAAPLPNPTSASVSAPADASRSGELLSSARAMGTARATTGARMVAIERLARELSDAGEGARRITVIGTVRNVGTTMTAIALARSLAGQSRVVLVELAVAAPNLSVIASDPLAPGLSELVQGSATFGQIITRDRHSRAHLIMAGRAAIDAAALMQSQRLSITIEALGRSYDHVVIDAGAADQVPLEHFAILAPRAVLVAADLDNPATALARERLLKAGFANVSIVVDAAFGPDIGATGAKAAA
jgi:succinoglycan biosynthesis transport protein ExoP